MKNKFDEPAKKLTHSVTRRPGMKKFAVALAGLALTLQGVTSAQTLVPLIVVPTNQVSGATNLAGLKMSSAIEVEGESLIYAAPSQVILPTIQPGATIAAPSGPDVQVNDLSQDFIQTLTTWKWPFEHATSLETTVATDGSNNIVVSYSHNHIQVTKYAGNDKAGPYQFAYQFVSHYSVSHDGGQSWRSTFLTPPKGSIQTLGDGVVAADRAGNFYYSTVGRDSNFNWGVLVGKSTDHGDTFAPAAVAALDPVADKDWIAVGPDPNVPSRDNVYVAWTSITIRGSTAALAFTRSTDGGISWSPARTLFAYNDDGLLSGWVGIPTPAVDKSNGRLYMTFLHAGDLNPDYVRVLVSDDGGNTFSPLAFNAPAAPDAYTYPFVDIGTAADCGKQQGIRLVVKQGPDIGGGLWTELDGVPRYVHCARHAEQPVTAAQNGRLVISFAASTSSTWGGPSSGGEIIALYSKDGGRTWFPPFTVAASTAANPQHFMPAIALSPDARTLYVGYYVQDSSEKIRTEMATLQVTGNGLQLLGYKPLSSVSFDIEPSNVPSPFSPLKSEDTVNAGEQLSACTLALGDYMGLTTDANGNPMAAWSDCRNTWVSPANGVFPGPHAKTDVFFVRP